GGPRQRAVHHRAPERARHRHLLRQYGVRCVWAAPFALSLCRAAGLALVTYITLNVGLITRAVVEPILALRPAPVWAVALIVSAVLQWIGATVFAANTWPRVRAR